MKRSRDSAAVERIQGSDAAASRSILRVPQGDPGESRSAVRGELDDVQKLHISLLALYGVPSHYFASAPPAEDAGRPDKFL